MRATRPRAAKPKRTELPPLVRLHETTGTATSGWDAAFAAAVKAARTEVGDVIAAEISRQWADLGQRGITRYHVNVKVAYRQPIVPPKRERKRAG